MKRKTNLFYTSGPDSKFLTFSNYTECLTGNYLSLETKLFPDKFLCLKINNLNLGTKPDFIKYLAAYYENKLALLRDYNIQNSNNVEINILPLAYLLEAILLVCDQNDNEWYLNETKIRNYNNNHFISDDEDTDDNNIFSKLNSNADNLVIKNLITYIGEITEQDYNGIYADTICTIDLNVYNEGYIVLKDNDIYNAENKITASNEIEDNYSLYGWNNDNLINSEYNEVDAIYDTEYTYSFNTILNKLKLREILKSNIEENIKTLSFNIIIPLFNLVNRNISSINWLIDENEYYKYIDLNDEHSHIYNVPYGIWINADSNEDTFIELKKDINLNMYPSWSLLISSQFKPFPYSNSLIEENSSKNSILHAHATYAEILTKLNNFIDIFSTFNNELLKLNNRVTSVENSLKEIGTVANISDVNKKLINTEINVTNMINDFKEKIYGYIDNITWTDNVSNKLN